ncbi:MAG: hypothetical protein GTN62_04310 [Gemmatimonadales bacterium]|nr:hypothetical protein [Gemmatimonadales bacterium]NIP06786.1 hypothetical protein [Gemmatimonadales bacterium]NIQ98903.1 hypothetical protein [Gemmatimonadales bacterium]NIS65077.1 hypothetical protein [Gemmatimonadales bacterium]
MTFDGHRTGDMKTYVYRTADYGETWQSLVTEDLDGYAHVIREDPENADLLFLGTEFGLFVSLDAGQQWARFGGGIPKVAVRDLAIHPREHDLIIATHGRGIYILDDLTPLRHLTRGMVDSAVVLLPSRPAAMVIPASVQAFPGDGEWVGENPPEAASVVYYLKRRHMFGDLRVEIYDTSGSLVATHPGGKRRGINRVGWPMRLKGPKVPPATSLVSSPGSFMGPRVPEGTYAVKLVKGRDTYETTVTLVPDPRATSSEEDRALQDRTVMRLYEMLGRLTYVVDGLIGLRDQAKEHAEVLGRRNRLARRLTSYADKLEAFRATLVSTSEAGRLSGEQCLREKLVELYGAVNGYEGAPTQSQLERAEILATDLGNAEREFATLTGRELESLNNQLERQRREPLKLMSKEEWERQ